jgi:type I restriction enzyme S subunit
MEEWREYKLGEITNMKNGKKRPQSNGVFPVCGGNGIMDYSDSYNAENTIIVGRVGAYCG